MKPGVLYVVATPIGNLSDITLRALEILRSADIIACEDTRKSRTLLSHWNISTRLMSLHKFSEARRVQTILKRLEQGENVAIISDAGTPAISDPGSRVVKAAMEAGFIVSPVPGPSSISAALSASGMIADTFVHLGFVPKKEKQRRTFFEELVSETRTVVFFETPKRICSTLATAAEILGNRRMVLLRELTKMHEEVLSGHAASILDDLRSRDAVKGEIVVVVEGATGMEHALNVDDAVTILVREGFSGKRLALEAHRRFGVKKGEAYETYLRMKRSAPGQDESREKSAGQDLPQ